MDSRIVVFLLILLLESCLASQKALEGKRTPCQNEGEQVPVPDNIDKLRCFSCICRHGFVECSNSCPNIDNCHMIVQEGCCKRCKGCTYKNQTFVSHTEWTDSSNPCTVLRCEAGVITESNLRCHTPCANPLPPEPGKCCPTCPECRINGQVASEDQDVISDDPCLKCRCGNGKLTCSKRACPVLQCHKSQQVPGECCQRCNGSRMLFRKPQTCTLQRNFLWEGETLQIDRCTTCSCLEETSVCKRNTCPILDCAPHLQVQEGEDCCKKCSSSVGELQNQCVHGDNVYEDGQSWKLDACSSCKCHRGMPSCAKTTCNVTLPCGPEMREVRVPGECCRRCEEVDGVCMVFGDPHYKTFDGKIYSLKGFGKYQLVSDCLNNSFTIRVANSASNKLTSTSTKRVGVRFGDTRINLQQKQRIKLNGQRIKLPHRTTQVTILKVKDNIEVTLQNKVKLLWNSHSFLEISVPASFKNKLCGLCGNFNGNVQDDLTPRPGSVFKTNDLYNFGLSWCVSKPSDCMRKVKPGRSCLKLKRSDKKNCKHLTNNEVFRECDSKISHLKYYKSCKSDMCNCPNGKCYCEHLMAYARECERLGIDVQNWQKKTMCEAHNKSRRPVPRPRIPSFPSFQGNVTKLYRKPLPIH